MTPDRVRILLLGGGDGEPFASDPRFSVAVAGRLDCFFPALLLSKARRSDVVVANRLGLATTLCLPPLRKLGLRTVFSARSLPRWLGSGGGSLASALLRGWSASALFRGVDLTLSFSAETTVRLREFLPKERHQIQTLRPTASVADFADVSDRRAVLTFADNSPDGVERKNLALFAALAAAFPETPFYIVGRDLAADGDYLLGLPPNCLFLDAASRPWALRNSSVLCQLDMLETSGADLAEALSAGLAAVAFDSAALPEAFYSRGAVLSRDGGFEQARAAVGRLLSSPAARVTTPPAPTGASLEDELFAALAALLGGPR